MPLQGAAVESSVVAWIFKAHKYVYTIVRQLSLGQLLIPGPGVAQKRPALAACHLKCELNAPTT